MLRYVHYLIHKQQAGFPDYETTKMRDLRATLEKAERALEDRMKAVALEHRAGSKVGEGVRNICGELFDLSYEYRVLGVT